MDTGGKLFLSLLFYQNITACSEILIFSVNEDCKQRQNSPHANLKLVHCTYPESNFKSFDCSVITAQFLKGVTLLTFISTLLLLVLKKALVCVTS